MARKRLKCPCASDLGKDFKVTDEQILRRKTLAGRKQQQKSHS